jgi:hypothetical protein
VVGRGVLGLLFVSAPFPLLAGVAAFGDGTRLAITDAAHAGLGAGARWALAGGVGAFALSLAVLHLGAEWTSLRDRTPAGRGYLAALALTLAAAGSHHWRVSRSSPVRCSPSCCSRRSPPAPERPRYGSRRHPLP